MISLLNIVPEEPEISKGPPAKFRRILGLGIRAYWDRLYLMGGISLLFAFAMSLPGMLISYGRMHAGFFPPGAAGFLVLGLLLALPYAFLLAPLLAGAAHICRRHLLHEETGLADYFLGVWKLGGAAIRLGIIQMLAVIIISVSLSFYSRTGGVYGGILTLLGAYALLLFGMMGIYHFPLLAMQEEGDFDEPEHRARRGALAVVRRAVFVTLGVPFLTLGLLVTLLIVLIPMLMTMAPFALCGLGLYSMLTTTALQQILIQLGVFPAPVEYDPRDAETFHIAPGPVESDPGE